MKIIRNNLIILFVSFCLTILSFNFQCSLKNENHQNEKDDNTIDDGWSDDSEEIHECGCNGLYLISSVLFSNKLNFYISFNTSYGDALMFAEGTPYNWSVEKVFTITTETYSMGDMAIDSNHGNMIFELDYNQPLIVFGDSNVLKTTEPNGETWTVTEIPDTLIRWAEFDAVKDTSGKIHLAFQHPDNVNPDLASYEIVYMDYEDGVWTSEVIANASYSDIGIASDFEDRPHIAYFDNTQNALVEIRWTSDGWETQLMETGIASVLGLDIANSSDGLGVAYYTQDGGGRFCFGQDAGDGVGWSIECMDEISLEYEYRVTVNLMFDSGDSPVASLGFGWEPNIIATQGAGGGWSFQQLQDLFGSDAHGHLPLAFDGNGNVVTSYYANAYGDPYHGDLMFAKRISQGIWTSDLVWASPVCFCAN